MNATSATNTQVQQALLYRKTKLTGESYTTTTTVGGIQYTTSNIVAVLTLHGIWSIETTLRGIKDIEPTLKGMYNNEVTLKGVL